MDGEYTRADDGWDSGWNDDDSCEDEMYNSDRHGSDSDVDLQELEEALYSQIHYGSCMGEAITCQVGDQLCDVQLEDKSEVQAEKERSGLLNDNGINEPKGNKSLLASGVRPDVSSTKVEDANFSIYRTRAIVNSKRKENASSLGLKEFLYENDSRQLDCSTLSLDAKMIRNERTDSLRSSKVAKPKINISPSKECVVIESSNSDVILLDSNTDEKTSTIKDLDSPGSCIVVDSDAVQQSPRTSAESTVKPDVVVIDSDFSSDQESDSSFLVLTSSDDDTSAVTKGKKKNSKLTDLNINIQDYKYLLESDDSDNHVEKTDTQLGLQKSNPLVGATSRYYGQTNMRCFNCNEKGHSAKSCPKPKSLPVCILCGLRGHLQNRCPDSLCYKCDHVGHLAKDCQSRYKAPYIICHRCRMAGHMASECPDLWRQYHITTRQGRLIRGSTKINKNPFCYNCAKKGHFGFECKKKPMEKRMLPCCPLISRYEIPNIPPYPMSHKRAFPDCTACNPEVPVKRPRIQQSVAYKDISEFASKAKKKLTKMEKKSLKIARLRKLSKERKKSAVSKKMTKPQDESGLISQTQTRNLTKQKRKKAQKKGSTALSGPNCDAIPLVSKITAEGLAETQTDSNQLSHSVHEIAVIQTSISDSIPSQTKSMTENKNKPPIVNISYPLNRIEKSVENMCELKSDTLPTTLKVTKTLHTSSTLNDGPAYSSSTPKNQPVDSYSDPNNSSMKTPSSSNNESFDSSSTSRNLITRTSSTPNNEPSACIPSSTPNNEIINRTYNPNSKIMIVLETRKSRENLAILDAVKIREEIIKDMAENVTVVSKPNTDCETESGNPVKESALKSQEKVDTAACVLSRIGIASECSSEHNIMKPSAEVISISSFTAENKSINIKKPSEKLCIQAKPKKKKKCLIRGKASDAVSSISSFTAENKCITGKRLFKVIENTEIGKGESLGIKNMQVLKPSSELLVKKDETEKEFGVKVHCCEEVEDTACCQTDRLSDNGEKDSHDFPGSSELNDTSKKDAIRGKRMGTKKKTEKTVSCKLHDVKKSESVCVEISKDTVKNRKKTNLRSKKKTKGTVDCNLEELGIPVENTQVVSKKRTDRLSDNGEKDSHDFPGSSELNHTSKKDVIRGKRMGTKKKTEKTVSCKLHDVKKSESVCVEISKDTVKNRKKTNLRSKKKTKGTVDCNLEELGIPVENTQVVSKKRTDRLSDNGEKDSHDFPGSSELNDTSKKDAIRGKGMGTKKKTEKTVSCKLHDVKKSESVCVEISKDTVKNRKKTNLRTKKKTKGTVDCNVEELGIPVENTQVVSKKRNNYKLLQIDKSSIITLNCCEACDSSKTESNLSVHNEAGKSSTGNIIFIESFRNKGSKNSGKQDGKPVKKTSKKTKEKSVSVEKTKIETKTKKRKCTTIEFKKPKKLRNGISDNTVPEKNVGENQDNPECKSSNTNNVQKCGAPVDGGNNTHTLFAENGKKGRRGKNRQNPNGFDSNFVSRTFYNENHNQRPNRRRQPRGPSVSHKQHPMVSERGFHTTYTSWP